LPPPLNYLQVFLRQPVLSVAPAFRVARKEDLFSYSDLANFSTIPQQGRGYYPFEGFQHGGLASRRRKRNTDFGSGLMREMFGSMKALAQANKHSIGRKLGEYIKRDVKFFVKGGPKAGSANVGFAMEEGKVKFGGILKYNRDKAMAMIENTIGKGKYSRDVMEDLGNITLFHEASEVFYGMKLAKKAAGQAEKLGTPRSMIDIAHGIMGNLAEPRRIGTHFSSGVLVDEALMAAKMGRETFSALKEFRMTEAARLNIRTGSKAAAAYGTRLQKILGAVEKKWLPRFQPGGSVKLDPAMPPPGMPSMNEAHHQISGMMHGGMAGSKRRMTTDHGSKWKGLFGGISRAVTKFMGKKAAPGAAKLLDPRKAAKMAQGQTLEEFTQALGNQNVLLGTRGTRMVERELEQTFAAGGSPEAIEALLLRKTRIQIMSEKKGLASAATLVAPGVPAIAYVHPEKAARELVGVAVSKGVPRELAEKVTKSEDFLKTIMYHEHLEAQVFARFPGKELMKSRKPGVVHGAGQVILGEAGFVKAMGNKELERFFTLLRKTKMEEKTFAAGLEAFGETGQASVLRKLTTDFGSGWRGLKSSISKVIAQAGNNSRAAVKLTQTSKDLRIAQENIWEWARAGGKGHVHPAGRHVQQISSNFGGNI